MSISAIPIAPAHAQHVQPRLPRPLRTREGSVGFVSTFPPTKCGLATFTASLAGALGDSGPIGVVSCVEERGETLSSPEVVAEWVRGSRSSLAVAVRSLSGYDTVVVQHEFGLFGGADGADILELVSLLEMPVVVVLHTVLEQPSPNQRRIVEELARLASRVVVQSEVARRRLLGAHQVDSSSIVVIPHGAPVEHRAAPASPRPGAPPGDSHLGADRPGQGDRVRDRGARLAEQS